MKKNIFLLFTVMIVFVGLFSGCLKTRSEVSPTEQSYISRKKMSDKQMESTKTETLKNTPAPVDPEEIMRTQNGRIEVLENQVAQLQKENLKLESSPEALKIAALQEALTKMEMQIQKLEGEKSSDSKYKSSDENLKSAMPVNEIAPTNTSTSKKNAFDLAEESFGKKEWKKAILSYQKFAEEFPKSKLVPDAKYKTGVSFQELGLKDEALAFYEEVSVQYPQTQAGKKAKIRMASLSTKNKSKKK